MIVVTVVTVETVVRVVTVVTAVAAVTVVTIFFHQQTYFTFFFSKKKSEKLKLKFG